MTRTSTPAVAATAGVKWGARAATATALVAGILAAGATPAFAHHPGKPGEYAKEKYLTGCASGVGTIREVPRIFPAINKPDTRLVQRGTRTERDGKHYHYADVQKKRTVTVRGKKVTQWVTVERRKTFACGVDKSRVLAPRAGTVRINVVQATTAGATDVALPDAALRGPAQAASRVPNIGGTPVLASLRTSTSTSAQGSAGVTNGVFTLASKATGPGVAVHTIRLSRAGKVFKTYQRTSGAATGNRIKPVTDRNGARAGDRVTVSVTFSGLPKAAPLTYGIALVKPKAPQPISGVVQQAGSAWKVKKAPAPTTAPTTSPTDTTVVDPGSAWKGSRWT